MYNQNKTLYNINIKRIIKTLIFATFQQPYLITPFLHGQKLTQNCKYIEKEENF